MKIEVVENKIKVSLSLNDLLYYNIKPESFLPNSPELHKFLFHIMENVKEETGFNPYTGQVIVEAVQADSGITLYISRIKKERKTDTGKKINIRAVKSKKTNKNRYMFRDFETLCNVLTMLPESSLENSILYKFENTFYYILKTEVLFEKTHCILSEHCTSFGGMMYTESFLKEHGTLIASGKKLVLMADGIKQMNKENK